MNFQTSKNYFIKNGKPYFLISGEIHYFRIDPKLWERHLRLLKESGANTTSTYIPWDWHEYEEGEFDFIGKTEPSRNLIKYIKLCKKVGLDLIVKPGPYILAEYEGQGIPIWLLKKISKEAHALDENGNIISHDLLSYLSEEYLHYTFLWFDQIMPIIEKYQLSKSGPIIMMQVCNEVGVFQWLSGKIDYNPVVISLYKNFLMERYKEIDELNKNYGTDYSTFNEISAPKGKIENKQDYCLYYDFHLFYRSYYSKYIKTLSDKIKNYGIETQLTHNIPGWIYGNAAELPMLISTYDEIMKTQKDIVFGVDHIPEFVSFRNAHSDLACNKILEAMQTDSPVWGAEFQAGTREHHVKCDPEDLETFYFASLAHGMKGFNYYMFSQGSNPKGKGYFGKTFYYQTPLDLKTNKNELYNSVNKVNHFIKKEGKDLLSSKTKANICVGLYKPYFYTELTTSQMLREKRLDVEKLGLQYDPRFVREELFFNGLLRSLQSLNFNYDIEDLENVEIESLLQYKQLWIISTEFMDNRTQQLLSDYVKKGGHLVIYPVLPRFDLYLNSCKALSNELNIKCSNSSSPNKIDAFGIEDIFTLFKNKQIFDIKDADIVAYTENGEVCGVRKKISLGYITALGFAFGYSSDEHLQLIEKIISVDKIKREAQISDLDIQFIIRKAKKVSYTFLLNYHNQKKFFKLNSKKLSLNPFSYKVLIQKNVKKDS